MFAGERAVRITTTTFLFLFFFFFFFLGSASFSAVRAFEDASARAETPVKSSRASSSSSSSSSFKVKKGSIGSSSRDNGTANDDDDGRRPSDSNNGLIDAEQKRNGDLIEFPLWHSLEYSSSEKNSSRKERDGGDDEDETDDGDEEFQKIGTISGTIVVNQLQQKQFRVKELKVHRDELSLEMKRKMRVLANKNELYRIRVPLNVLQPRAGKFAQAASKAKCVIMSRLREAMTLHMDDNGNVLGIDYDAECQPEVYFDNAGVGGEGESLNTADAVFIADQAQFRSVATARFPKKAPQLNADVLTDVRGHGGPMDQKKAEQIKQRRAKGEKVSAAEKDLTFWQKYYMYIIPVVYFLFMNMFQGEEYRGTAGAAASSTPKTGETAKTK